MYFRLTVPFMTSTLPEVFVSDLGNQLEPNAEVRWTNRLDFWTASRTNRLGFLDREIPSPKRSAASCHVAVIGDSFVEAKDVPISEKLHVRLEALAARQLPGLDVTTSAFGKSGTGQIAQLPYYGVARRFAPKLVVLVFVHNDFLDNHPVLKATATGHDPEAMPWVTAARAADGAIRLRPPVPMRRQASFPLAQRDLRLFPGYATIRNAYRSSYFASWLWTKIRLSNSSSGRFPQYPAWTEHVRQMRDYESVLRGWPLADGGYVQTFRTLLAENAQVPAVEDALAFTAFALDQFKAQTERDGAALAILATHTMRTGGDLLFDRMSAMATSRGLPVVDQYDFVVRNGGNVEDLTWPHDRHWNAAGHRWAARALLEYLRQEPEICSNVPVRSHKVYHEDG